MSPKEECEILFDKLLSIAEDQLKKHGEFYPFGAVLDMDGTKAITAFKDDKDFPDCTYVLNQIIRGHKQQAEAGKIKASGIVWNAGGVSENGKKFDSIAVSLEHKDNYSVVVGRKYKIGLFKRVTFGEIFAIEGHHDVF